MCLGCLLKMLLCLCIFPRIVLNYLFILLFTNINWVPSSAKQSAQSCNSKINKKTLTLKELTDYRGIKLNKQLKITIIEICSDASQQKRQSWLNKIFLVAEGK